MVREHQSEPMLGSDDPLAVLLEAVTRLVILALSSLWLLIRLAVMQPLLVLLAGLGAGSWLVLGRPYTFAGFGCFLLMLGMWWCFYRDSYVQLVSPRLATVWREPMYRMKWPRIARRHRLMTHNYGLDDRSDIPRVRRVQVTPAGAHRLLLKLPAGLTPSDVSKACDGLAHAFGCIGARTAPEKPGWVWLELLKRDSLESVVSVLRHPSEVDLERLPIGKAEDGRMWTLRLAGTHVLIAGATGAGKGSVLWSLLNAISAGIRAATVQAWVIDPKGGMELRPGLPLFARFEDGSPEAMCELLEELVTFKDQRARQLAEAGARLHTATPASPHVVLIIDELATLTAFAERAVVRRIDQALGLLLTQGRACGITVVAAVQDPGKDVVGWRDLFPTRVALRLDNPIQVDMVLGDGARDGGARADQISELTPGVAFVRVEGTRAVQRVRAAYLNDDDVVALAASVKVIGGEPA